MHTITGARGGRGKSFQYLVDSPDIQYALPRVSDGYCILVQKRQLTCEMVKTRLIIAIGGLGA